MTLTNKAYLEVKDGAKTGQFEFELELEHTAELTKKFILSNKGQNAETIISNTPVLGDLIQDNDRRSGYWVDGGAGTKDVSIAFETGNENKNITWGDGSGGTGPSNTNPFDASGKGIDKITRMNVLEFWLSNTLTDARNPGLLYYGENTDGKFEGTPGDFSAPMPVAVTDHSFSTDTQDSSTVKGSISMTKVEPFTGDGLDAVVDRPTSFVGAL